jgi:LCP family protein required for cell wall assembly
MIRERKGEPTRATARAPRGRIARGLRWVGVMGLVLLAVGGSYVLVLGATIWSVSHQIYHPLPPAAATPTASVAESNLPEVIVPVLAPPTLTPIAPFTPPAILAAPAAGSPPADAAALPPGRINILVLGIDTRSELNDPLARSDTLIVLSVDPQAQTAGILSVPRDLQVSLPGYGLQKINAAYFFGEADKLPGGGPGLALTAVSQLLDVAIPYYVTVDFAGFRTIVDELGGIDLYVPEAIDDPLYPGPYNSYIDVQFAPGCQHLDGERALEYARTRHGDSDFARSERQQQVIKAIRAQALALNVLPQYVSLLSGLGDSITTNIPPEQQWALAQVAGQIGSGDVYTAQLDYNSLLAVPGTTNFVLWHARAAPLLDWFFGRGTYMDAHPGSLPPVVGSAAADADGLPTAARLIPGESASVRDPLLAGSCP